MCQKIKEKINFHLGYKVLFFYIFFIYAPGFVVSFILGDFYKDYYGFESSYFPILLIPLFVTVTYFLDLLTPSRKLIKQPLRSMYGLHKCLLGLALIYLIFSFFFFFEYGFTFRHSGIRILEANWYVKYIIFFKVFFQAILFALFLHYLLYGKVNNISKFLLVILLFSTFLSIYSSTDVITIAVIILLLLPYKLTNNLLFKIRKLSFTEIGACFLSLILIALITIFVGMINKKLIRSENHFLNSSIKHKAIETGKRISNSYISLMAIGNDYLHDKQLKRKAICSPIHLFIHRVKFFLGKETYDQRPNGKSVASLNWRYTRKNQMNHFQTGASPSLITSALYIPYFPLGILFIAIYALVIIRLFKRVEKLSYKPLSILSIAVIFFFIIPIFASPIDYLLNPTNPLFLYCCMFLFILSKVPLVKVKN